MGKEINYIVILFIESITMSNISQNLNVDLP